jgi:hypothetical protein
MGVMARGIFLAKKFASLWLLVWRALRVQGGIARDGAAGRQIVLSSPCPHVDIIPQRQLTGWPGCTERVRASPSSDPVAPKVGPAPVFPIEDAATGLCPRPPTISATHRATERWIVSLPTNF